jgi:predicted dehydrogenase
MTDMNENENRIEDFNRRDFLKSGSVATMMAMLGGVEVLAQTAAPAAAAAAVGPKTKVAVIGAGKWGREIISTLARLTPPIAEVAVICDTNKTARDRAAKDAPKAAQVEDYKAVLDNKDIGLVILATPTHRHKDIVVAALKAGKHVYCEAPLAHTIEDAKAIAEAAKAAPNSLFQAGLQFRSDPVRNDLPLRFKSGDIGQPLMVRAQWHDRSAGKNATWRWMKESSPGLVGEKGIHAIDMAMWLLRGKPLAVSGLGASALPADSGGDAPDTVQAVLEFPDNVWMNYDATVANSFDGEYEMYYGTYSAMLLRESKAWMFKEVDSPLLGWEVYAAKEVFYKETGIVIKVQGTSKAAPATGESAAPAPATPAASAAPATGGAPAEAAPAPAAPAEVPPDPPLYYALQNFVRNGAGITKAIQNAKDAFGDDPDAIALEVAKFPRWPAAGYLEGYQATVAALKANEAILGNQRLVLKPESFKLG